MKILLTGSRGFVGTHFKNLYPIISLENDACQTIDLRNYKELERFCSANYFDAVIHLAAQSSVSQSLIDPEGTFEVNFKGTFNLLNALRLSGFNGRFLFIGSGDVYGNVSEDKLPVKEEHPLKPRNPYAVSKTAAEALCFQWSQSGFFDIILARPFNQIGPGQNPHFAISNFARQLIEIKSQLKPPEIEVGNLDVTRDFTDVRDSVRAYRLLLEHGRNGEVYNICSGKEISLNRLLNKMIELAQIDFAVTIKNCQERERKLEQKRVSGNAEKLYLETKWKPVISFDQTLLDILNYWENAYTCTKKL